MATATKKPSDLMRSRARHLRKTLTDEEKSLWYALKDLRKDGVRFRKQVPIGRYIVDFVCLKAKLVLEIDGLQHSEPYHEENDRIRDQWLQKEGFTVLRFWNDEVMNNRNDVINHIIRNLPLEGGGGWSEAEVGGGETHDR